MGESRDFLRLFLGILILFRLKNILDIELNIYK